MNGIYVHNPTSRAWEQLIALIDRREDQLKGIGVARPLFDSSRSSRERQLVAHDFILKISLEYGEISVSILNDSVPLGQLPKPRKFSAMGDVQNPLLMERDGSGQQVGEVFDDVIAWFVGFGKSRQAAN